MKNYTQYLAEAMAQGHIESDVGIFWTNFHRKNRMKGLLYSPILHTYKSFYKSL